MDAAPSQPRPHYALSERRSGETRWPAGSVRRWPYVEAAAEASLSATASKPWPTSRRRAAWRATAGFSRGRRVLNRYTGIAEAAPGLVALENDVIGWLCREMGYGSSAAGLFTSGGSLATLLAVTTARDAHAHALTPICARWWSTLPPRRTAACSPSVSLASCG